VRRRLRIPGNGNGLPAPTAGLLATGVFLARIGRSAPSTVYGDIIVGIIGALIGGFILSLFGLGANGFWTTLITAFIGACILIAILRAVSGSRVTT